METIVADGGSTDGTRKVIELYRTMHPEHKVVFVENPDRIIPAGLNRAIEASTGEILMRLDGHSRPSQGYLEACVRLIQDGRGDMVGGVLDIVPRDGSWQARSVAAAVSNPVGVGDSHFRFSKEAQEVDTIAFCAFRREWIERIGNYDESLLSNEDYEFNSRLRKAGGKIWLEPSLRVQYFPPATILRLHKQYWRYGYWKARMALRFPETLRWRQFLPPAVLLVGLVLLAGGFLSAWLWWILSLISCLYGALLLATSVTQACRRADLILLVGMPISIATMHVSWAGAFLWSLATGSRKR